ncbi:hypothetical protein SISSUDRAFT_1061730 [Sistotremastrum suecicum HHB10207 ss-3]|uniref:Uncharacterized protein n=1 Tax=Sistotremastrum suecicum HHB10207 ss-3 TaxID=1314776 RepID=A0A166DMI3_9AGAM|nr:hypothetical protein SISSUDRAFT_1061730 [Sistotremastrum suecicum HHB10207 ss-3]
MVRGTSPISSLAASASACSFPPSALHASSHSLADLSSQPSRKKRQAITVQNEEEEEDLEDPVILSDPEDGAVADLERVTRAAHSRKKKRTAHESALCSLGHTGARRYGGWGVSRANIYTYIDAITPGLGKEAKEDKYQRRQMRRVHKEVEWMFTQYPMSQYMKLLKKQKAGTALHSSLAYARDYYDTGRNEQRATDTSTIKDAIANDFGLPRDHPDHINWKPALDVKERSKWGFEHDQISPFIAPYPLDWSDPRVQERLRSAGSTPTADDLFMFMWAYCKVGNKYAPMADILCSPFLVKIWKATYFVPCGEERMGTGFEVEAFYSQLLKMFDEQKYITKEIMDWWKRQIYPAAANSKAPDGPVGGYAVMLKMHKEGERRKQAVLAAAKDLPPTSSDTITQDDDNRHDDNDNEDNEDNEDEDDEDVLPPNKHGEDEDDEDDNTPNKSATQDDDGSDADFAKPQSQTSRRQHSELFKSPSKLIQDDADDAEIYAPGKRKAKRTPPICPPRPLVPTPTADILDFESQLMDAQEIRHTKQLRTRAHRLIEADDDADKEASNTGTPKKRRRLGKKT